MLVWACAIGASLVILAAAGAIASAMLVAASEQGRYCDQSSEEDVP